jgi:phage anti-repressor protein
MQFTIMTLPDDPTVEVVDAREVHAELGSGSDFTTWFKERIQQTFLTQGKDYWFQETVVPTTTGAVRKHIYYITLDTAKHLGMVEHTEKGKMVRDYFIERDKAFRQHLQAQVSQQQSLPFLINDIQTRLDAKVSERDQYRKLANDAQSEIDSILRYVDNIREKLSEAVMAAHGHQMMAPPLPPSPPKLN